MAHSPTRTTRTHPGPFWSLLNSLAQDTTIPMKRLLTGVLLLLLLSCGPTAKEKREALARCLNAAYSAGLKKASADDPAGAVAYEQALEHLSAAGSTIRKPGPPPVLKPIAINRIEDPSLRKVLSR